MNLRPDVRARIHRVSKESAAAREVVAAARVADKAWHDDSFRLAHFNPSTWDALAKLHDALVQLDAD